MSAMRPSSSKGLGAATFVVAVAIALAACGREQLVQLVPEDSGGLADAAFGGDGSPQSDASTRPCDMIDAGPRQSCRGNGASCQGANDCCSSRCQGNVCLAAGACSGPGASCSTRDQCCSGRCEPGGGVGGGAKKCTNYCLADGASCAGAQECCSLACNGGVCGGALCFKEESACTSSSECCSGNCDGDVKRCRVGGGCKGTGDECETTECCSGVCTSGTSGARCDPGPGPCRPPGSFCNADGDCCRAPCSLGANGYKTCAAPPLPDGQPCGSNADCASRICTGVPPVCGAPSAQCKLVGSTCDIASDCCSDQCQAGYCASNCLVH